MGKIRNDESRSNLNKFCNELVKNERIDVKIFVCSVFTIMKEKCAILLVMSSIFYGVYYKFVGKKREKFVLLMFFILFGKFFLGKYFSGKFFLL